MAVNEWQVSVMLLFLSLSPLLVFGGLPCSSPTIGILSHPCTASSKCPEGVGGFVKPEYVEFIQEAGGSPVALSLSWDEVSSTTLQNLDGALLQTWRNLVRDLVLPALLTPLGKRGGLEGSGDGRAEEGGLSHEAGLSELALFGVCLGFQYLSFLGGRGTNKEENVPKPRRLLQNFYSFHEALPLNFLNASESHPVKTEPYQPRNFSILDYLPRKYKRAFEAPSTWQRHRFGFSRARVENNELFQKHFRLVASSFLPPGGLLSGSSSLPYSPSEVIEEVSADEDREWDRGSEGGEFVSLLEGRSSPVVGAQFHPEWMATGRAWRETASGSRVRFSQDIEEANLVLGKYFVSLARGVCSRKTSLRNLTLESTKQLVELPLPDSETGLYYIP